MTYATQTEIAEQFAMIKGLIDNAVAAGNLAELKMHGTCLAGTSELSEKCPNVAALLLEYCRAAFEFVWLAGDGFVVAPAPLLIADGTYTLVYLDGSYRTFRVREVKTGRLAGKRIVEYLNGPDNGLDFQAFATVNATSVNVWQRFERGQLVNLAREIETVARGGGLEAAGLAYAEKSGRCRRCSKVLTVPASLAAGYGPDCAAKIGISYGEDRRGERPAARCRCTEGYTCDLCAQTWTGIDVEDGDPTIRIVELDPSIPVNPFR